MSAFLIEFEGFDPDEEGHREALCTLGNGYFATRGALSESVADDVHYPGTYVAGVYNRLPTEIAGRRVENESLVNAPNWLPLSFRAEDGTWFSTETCDVLDHRTELDMFRGTLTRHSRLRDPDGRIVSVTQRRFVSMRDPHIAGLETTVVAENWSGRLCIRSALDGSVTNAGVARYASLPNRHLRTLCTDQESDELICLHVETNQSHVRIAEAARTRVYHHGKRPSLETTLVERSDYVGLDLALEIAEGEPTTVEKIVSLFTSRDHAISEPGEEACARLTQMGESFEVLLERHVVSWRQLWDRVRLDLGTDGSVAQLLNLHTFHVLQTVSNNSIGLDVGVPARGLHGEAYRGHVFWDELFILPFLSLRIPQLARELLLYRYRRLDQARLNALNSGYTGAMFPWQSASSGREETPTTHFNPISGHWIEDASHRQRHVNAAIAHNTWHYFEATGDLEFLIAFGAELILEIARFWSSATTYNRALDRYEILGVMGPDEFHERYPDQEAAGIDNNSYTNVMAVWCLGRAFETLSALPPAASRELRERLLLSEQELDRWRDISRKMRVCFHDGVISQFEGYEDLEELDWAAYRDRYGNITRLDRILEAEGDDPSRYQLTKQADARMLLYVLSRDELLELLAQLGYECDEGVATAMVDYYEPRTAHGSTLSRVVHAWDQMLVDHEQSWDIFVEALRCDMDDVQGGTTKEGIHLGAMAGTIDLIQRCFPGLEIRGDVLRFDPKIPPELGTLAFDIRYRSHLLHLEFTTERARIRMDENEGATITVAVGDQSFQLGPGETLDVPVEN